MSKTRSDKAPTHEIFAVRKDSDDKNAKGFWTKIGAAWPHKDGEGFSLKLDFLPLDGSEISLRKRKPKPDVGAA
jgi:hypothetical protein